MDSLCANYIHPVHTKFYKVNFFVQINTKQILLLCTNSLYICRRVIVQASSE
jgi:hypothetical protein